MTNCEIIEQEISELEKKQIDYGTAEKLAWLYIVRDHIKTPKTLQTQEHTVEESMISMERAVSKPEMMIKEESDSEFLKIIEGKDLDSVLAVIDETMSVLQTTLPRIYNNTMAKLYNL